MSATTLATGLGGAIGCDLRRAQNQLLFVEFNGKLSRLNLFRTGTIVSSGTAVLHGTWHFDFDAGVQVSGGPGADVWWEQKTAILRDLVPQNGAMLANVGHVGFGSITPDTLSSLTYTTTPIVGNDRAAADVPRRDKPCRVRRRVRRFRQSLARRSDERHEGRGSLGPRERGRRRALLRPPERLRQRAGGVGRTRQPLRPRYGHA